MDSGIKKQSDDQIRKRSRRKKFMTASGKSEERPAIARAPIVGLWDWDLRTGMIYFSPAYKRQLGYEDSELAIGFEEWELRLHAEDRDRVTQSFRRYLADPSLGYEAEYRLQHKDGAYRWMLARAEVIRDASGSPSRMLGCQFDLTDSKRADEDRARLAAIVESSDDAIIGKTLHGIITSWNQGAERLFAYTAEEMVGQPVSKLIPSDRLDEEADILARLRRGERVMHFETVRRCKNGRLIDVSLSTSPIRDGSGRIIGASKIARDVSTRKRVEAAIEQANERLREQAAVLELAPVLVRDLEGRIVLWTQGAERLYGFSKEEALGRISHELFQTEFPEAHLEAKLRSAGQWEGKLVHRKRNGERIMVASQQIVFRDGDGRPVRILETNTDITVRQEAEEELSRSQEQLRALTARLNQVREEEAIRMARELHDELGRGLTMMKMDVAWIERALLLEELNSENALALRERAGRIKQAIDETAHKVRRISSELRPGPLDDLGLAAAIEWQSQDFQKRTGIVCVVELPEEELRVGREQATALFRIFQESLTNVARHARATKIWVHLSEEVGEILLEVEDNGVGISPARMAESRSLGLLGMRERAGAFGGVVEISGMPVQGTTVVVRMPVLGINDENPDR